MSGICLRTESVRRSENESMLRGPLSPMGCRAHRASLKPIDLDTDATLTEDSQKLQPLAATDFMQIGKIIILPRAKTLCAA
jgi:hypothetical protein